MLILLYIKEEEMSKKEFSYKVRIDAETEVLSKKMATVKESLRSILAAGKAPGVEKTFEEIEKALGRLQQKTAQPIDSMAAFKGLEKDAALIGLSLTKLGKQITDLRNISEEDKLELMDESTKQRVVGIQKALEAYETTISEVSQASKDLAKNEEDLAAAEQELKKASAKASEKKQLVEIQKKAVEEANAEKKAIYEKLSALKQYQETLAAYEKAGGHKGAKGDSKVNEGKGLGGLNLPADKKAAQAVMPELDLNSTKDVSAAVEELSTQYSQASKAATDATAVYRKYDKQMQETANASSLAQTKVDDLKASQAKLKIDAPKEEAANAAKAYTDLRDAVIKLDKSFKDIPVEYTEENLAQLQKKLEQTKTEGFDKVVSGCNSAETQLTETVTASDKMNESLERNKQTAKELDDRMNQTQAFANRIKQFVGIEGAARLARKAFQDAFKTIKELDAAMTEMAVVTELDVGDYWDRLPEYTERANALGVSIKSAYESATLYYQQGLKNNEVTAISNETLKMMRIANLSAEDATNKMTAALRGFNMELNETSAQKVADVYSKLAAITASDVNEISTAMTKTASIAASAGMEFETTAAFLSQIIETTRESAETAGTAMKTVIARFQELKKDPAEIGEVDGEIVDANKIETALRSVGVSLRDTSGQFRELDDVFLELSGKWDSLDTNTQRYIATIAAGSRQQSRFIAMMANYSRTQELVNAANNSAGASNEQFAKTLDSLESKMNQLKNSWDTFTMSLMDSTILKAGIDLLNGLMTTINGIIALFDKVGLGGAASLGMVIGALAMGTKLLNAFELNMRATDATGKKLYTTLGAIGQTAKQSFKKLLSSVKNLRTTLIKTFSAKLNVKVGSEDLYKATQASKAYQKATNDLKQTELSRAAAAKAGNLTDAQAAMFSQQAADATAMQSAAEKELMATMGLSAAQMASVQAMEALGITTGSALILTKAGISAAAVAQTASILGLGTAETAETLAQNLSNSSGIVGLSTRIALTVANWAQTASEGAKTGSIWANITATIAQTMANWGLQGSMWPILIIGLLIIAALAILIVSIMLIVKLFKAIKANSPEGKLSAAKDAAEQAGEAAAQAAEAYQNLSDSFDSLSDKYNALEDLTQGTREWRDAVKEINSEVMDLVEQYPELANLVTSENGVLTLDIESDEAQAVLDSYEQKSLQASSAEMAAKMDVIEKQKVVDYKNLSNGATLTNEFANVMGYIGAGFLATGGAAIPGGQLAGIAGIEAINQKKVEDKANTEAMAKALADGLILEGEGGWQVKDEAALEALGLTADEAVKFAEALGDNADELKEYGETVNALDEQQKALLESMALNAVQMVNTAKLSAEEIQQVNVAANADYAKTFQSQELARLERLSDEDFKTEAEKVAKQMYGDSAEVDKNGDVTYTDSEGNEKTIERDQFEDQVAATNSSELMAEALEKLPGAIDATSRALGSAGKSFEKTYAASEGKALTKADVAELAKLTDSDLMKAYNSLTADEQDAFGDFETFKEHVQESKKLAEEAFETATKTLDQMGATVEFHSNLTSGAVKGFAEQLEYVMSAAGQAGVEEVNSKLNALADGLSESQLEKLMGQINALDWKNMDDWESLPDTLAELGIAVPQDELDAFIKSAQEAAGAIKKVDLEKLNESMQNLSNMSSKIKSGEQGRTFSSSDYEALIAMDGNLAGSFQQTLSGEFVYLGSSMATLTEAINANTDALLGRAISQLKNKVDAGQLMGDMADSWTFAGTNVKMDISKWADWDNDENDKTNAGNYLKTFIEQANASGMDLSQLGIAGLSNNTNVDSLVDTPEKIDAIMDQLASTFGNLQNNLSDLNDKTVNAIALSYQNRNATVNSAAASNYREKLMTSGSLNDSEWAAFRGNTNAITAQAASAGVSNVQIANYTRDIAAMKELEEQLKNGTITFEKFQAEYAKYVDSVEDFERTVVNATNLKNMETAAINTFSTIGEEIEKVKKITDPTFLEQSLNQILATFGLTVENFAGMTNEEIRSMLVNLVSGGTEGFLALDQVALAMGQSLGLTFEEIANMGTYTWDGMLNDQTNKYVQFANMVSALGLGMWKELENGHKQFTWINPAQYTTSVQEAGTEEEKWENSYDYIYNYNEEINRLIREREKAERAYQRALEDSSKSASDLLSITEQELGALEQQADVHSAAIQKALQSNEQLFKENSQFAKYVQYDAATGSITLDTNALENADFSAEEGEKFDAFLAALTENRDTINDAEDALYDIEDQVKEIKNRGRDAASSLYDAIRDGLVAERQEEIDKLSEINDSINEAQSNLVNQIQKQIDDARQARENEKTEQNISDKEARLAYLMRDTSGNNTAEILALQKELEDEKQGYADSLVDQKLQELTDSNEQAAQQRERQIALLQAELDAYAESQTIWHQIEEIIRESYSVASGSADFDKAWMNSQAGYYLKVAGEWDTLNPVAKDQYTEEQGQNAKLAHLYTNFGAEGTTAGDLADDTMEKIDGVTTAVGQVKTEVGVLGNTSIPDGADAVTSALPHLAEDVNSGTTSAANHISSSIYNQTSALTSAISGIHMGGGSTGSDTDPLGGALDGGYEGQASAGGTGSTTSPGTGDTNNSGYSDEVVETSKLITRFQGAEGSGMNASKSGDNGIIMYNGTEYEVQNSGKTYGKNTDLYKAAVGLKGFKDRQIFGYKGKVYGYLDGVIQKLEGRYWSDKGYKTFVSVMKAKYTAFETGGLADFTGPAWLDGTKSSPELVLNSTDTRNFIMLKDILGDILQGTSTIKRQADTDTKGGDNYYEIEINVDSLNEDYDVEQLADKIKSMIYEDSVYRNVNTVHLIR
jgi:hypothetical protein